ncbi:hypothetical protein ACFVT2_04255 [Streptomyces sp. NPDC058000]|uniref:hypothetical protein n=1 Tax=Streptomyces sp. NPDC058000 TaxID=3346299 RepID=UPI0036EA46BF
MTSIERTAYPRFKRLISVYELHLFFAPSREHIRRFGEYSTHELADEPDAYDPRLDVDCTPIRGDGPPAKGRMPELAGACRRAPHGALAPRPRADPGDRVEVTAIGRPARRRSPG